MPNHVKNIIEIVEPFTVKERKKIWDAVRIKDGNPDYEGIDKNGTFDFNRLIPMPKSLNIEAGSTETHSIEVYLTMVNPSTRKYGNVKKMDEEKFVSILKRLNRSISWGGLYNTALDDVSMESCKTIHLGKKNAYQLGKQAVNNLIKYGYTDWYDWCIANWGTKWNAYDFYRYDFDFEFNTAWSAPHPVIEKLAKKFPKCRFIHKWADEDIGNNCGEREYCDGEVVSEWRADDEDVSHKTAIEFACDLWGSQPEDYGLVLNEAGTDYEYKED